MPCREMVKWIQCDRRNMENRKPNENTNSSSEFETRVSQLKHHFKGTTLKWVGIGLVAIATIMEERKK